MVRIEQPRLSEIQLGITAAAIAGDPGSVYRLVANLLDEGTPFETVLFDILLRSEREVGLRWQAGDYLVTDEHAATATLETVIALLAGSLEQPANGSAVVVATAPGDSHSLPARAVAAHLLDLGHRTAFLGANVLASDLREYLEFDAAEAVVLSGAMASHLLGARDAIRESHSVGVPVLVGGRAFGENGMWAKSVGADAWVAAPGEVADHLALWAPDVDAAEAGAKNPSGVLEGVIERHNAVLAEAEARLAHALGKPPGARLRAELATALSVTEASMLVDDPRPLLEFSRWQGQILEAHGFGNHLALVTGLAGALDDTAPQASEWIRRVAQGMD
jgi:methanogenic corrinoid protein MtbC1